MSGIVNAFESAPVNNPGSKRGIVLAIVQLAAGNQPGQLAADMRVGSVVGVKSDESMVRSGGGNQLFMRAGYAAGGDRAGCGPEKSKDVGFERAFGNNDSAAGR